MGHVRCWSHLPSVSVNSESKRPFFLNPAFTGGRRSLSHSCNRIRVVRTVHLCPEWSQCVRGELRKWDYVVRPFFSLPVLPTLISLARSHDQFCHTSLETNSVHFSLVLLLCWSGNVNPPVSVCGVCFPLPQVSHTERECQAVVMRLLRCS